MKGFNIGSALLAIILSLSFGCNRVTSIFNNEYKQNGCSIPGQSDPDNSVDYVKRGDVHGEMHDPRCQMLAYDRAITLDSDNSYAFSKRGGAFRDQKEYSKAIADLTTAIEKSEHYTDKSDYYVQRGLIYEDVNQFDNALSDEQNAWWLLDASENNDGERQHAKSVIKARMAEIYYKKGQLDLAQSTIDEAMINIKGDYPDDASVYLIRDNIYEKTGKPDLAEADRIKAKELEPDKK